jgi:hypothetical protein
VRGTLQRRVDTCGAAVLDGVCDGLEQPRDRIHVSFAAEEVAVDGHRHQLITATTTRLAARARRCCGVCHRLPRGGWCAPLGRAPLPQYLWWEAGSTALAAAVRRTLRRIPMPPAPSQAGQPCACYLQKHARMDGRSASSDEFCFSTELASSFEPDTCTHQTCPGKTCPISVFITRTK